MPTLDWLNRAEALTSSGKVPYRVLEPVSEHGDISSPRPLAGEGQGVRAHYDNLLIQGDNLDALKALLPFYRGRVKCILSTRRTTPKARSSITTTTSNTASGCP